ncbi:MAG: hypothetical protein CMJ94_12555, partial [Planctomycetes bacterium]|nr:hypothetical protein [Planctomycetota bacterium]
MQRSATIADILSLLDELEGKVHQDSRLEAEWEAALSEQPTAAVRSDEAARFREWFLLERDSEHLGAPPVQAFAPQEIEDDSSWARLLDNFLGIFRLEGTRRVEGREVLDVADLWSGRTAHLPLDILSGASIDSEDLLLVGRLVLADDEIHLPLPGLRLAHAPGLARAVEADLALARHHQPR